MDIFKLPSDLWNKVFDYVLNSRDSVSCWTSYRDFNYRDLEYENEHLQIKLNFNFSDKFHVFETFRV